VGFFGSVTARGSTPRLLGWPLRRSQRQQAAWAQALLHRELQRPGVELEARLQGGATARALLADGSTSVRVMVRTPEAPNAKALAAAGAEVVVGDLDDPASLRTACAGARAVFSMQSPIMSATGIDYSKERQQGRNLVEAALAEGVGTFVHTATSGVGDHREVEGWAEGRWKSHEGWHGPSSRAPTAFRP